MSLPLFFLGRCVILLSVLQLLLGSDPLVAAPRYLLTDLGTLGGPASEANGINNPGQIAGTSSLSESIYPHAFLYTPGEGMQDLDTLGGVDSLGQALNDVGQVTGYSHANDLVSHAFLSTPGIGMVDIGTLSVLDNSVSVGFGINNAGQVVGSSSVASSFISHAFLYTPGQGMQDLGSLGGTSGSVAYSINNAGQVVGVSFFNDSVQHAFLYTPGEGMQDLGTLGGTNSRAHDINDIGEIVGYATSAGCCNGHAFLYTPGGGMIDLGVLDGGWLSSAQAINQAGQVVGYSYTRDNPMQINAFLYTATTGMVDLNALVVNGSGWWLSLAHDINDRGHIIGSGTYNGEGRAFLLTPLPSQTVTFDVRPGSAVNLINPQSNGVMPVAILSTNSVDVSTIDQASVRFGPHQALPTGSGQLEDVHGDGQPDLLPRFRTQESGIQCGDTSVALTGETVDGMPIQGSETIRTVGCQEHLDNGERKGVLPSHRND